MRVIQQKSLFIQKHNVRAKCTTFFTEREDKSTFQEQELTVCEGARAEKECLEALKDMGTDPWD